MVFSIRDRPGSTASSLQRSVTSSWQRYPSSQQRSLCLQYVLHPSLLPIPTELTIYTVLPSLPNSSHRLPPRTIHGDDHLRRHRRHPSRPDHRSPWRRSLYSHCRRLRSHHPPPHSLHRSFNSNVHMALGNGCILHREEVQQERDTWYPY